jgi:hypothetical protein
VLVGSFESGSVAVREAIGIVLVDSAVRSRVRMLDRPLGIADGGSNWDCF